MTTTTKSKALILHGAKDLRLETRDTPVPTGNEVQLAIRATGLCGSDLHYYIHGRNGDFVVQRPMALGHESSGLVTATGPDVKTLRVGDRVALEVGLPCRKCLYCASDRYNLCANMRFRSSAKTFPHLDGTLMQFTNHPEDMCHKLPDSVSYAGGALAEPLAVCLHAIRRSHPPTKEEAELARSLGEESAAMVFGAGAIGLLMAAALATSQHFSSIIIADIDARRLKVAESLGLGLKTHLIERSATTPPAKDAPQEEQTAYAMKTARETADKIKKTHNIPNGFARVYECTGVPPCIQAGIYAAAAGGVLVQVGMGAPILTLHHGAAMLREVDIIGVFRYDKYAYPAAIELLEKEAFKRVEDKIVTHRVDLSVEGQGERAFTLAAKGVDEEGVAVVKVLIESSF
ncbi:zinc-dependent alcohol dehydrogenase, putative [Talaromyces stipitatus ATCC 10500]|uniref:Zinc-dependent alcohol dehydrogenase, putative n=1 Tax=Talaromyces stipitatus (strain ATCC 10500 / CBS 375.48 / QM 6759 / NRRL 1006) TaxID=441959 RepID=B8M1U9_TALSN|nr:zinc-dependent alcohol dehydrogenase, putative [Talaromyces stipitatus ATCC 10500]EED21327.1 zinc-dependent alcohol dehydrogenase, putative [Talaromyces stipitatus ATCC 10500]